MTELPEVLYSLVTLCLALAFAAADGQTPTTRALVVGVALQGAGEIPFLWLKVLDLWPPGVWWPLALSPVSLALVAFAEWVLLVLRTVPGHAAWQRWVEYTLRVAQLAQLSAIALLLIFAEDLGPARFLGIPSALGEGLELLINQIIHCLFVIAEVCLALPLLIMLLSHTDLQERQRVIGVLCALPFFIAAELIGVEELWLPLRMTGIMVAVVGVVKYHVMQGQRGQFLARFLSPQVGELVRAQGLLRALNESHLEITIVSCDLRGFTAYSQTESSANVVGVLRDYYNVVSEVVARYGGTIKDIAGDGILILVGAPLALTEHAQCGLEIARAARDAVQPVLARWATARSPLGIGIGVASGPVTAGVIDAAFRLEYAAIGPAVNLASRLCSQAADREIRVSARTAELAGEAQLQACIPVALKGVGDAVPHFALPA